MVIGAGIAFRKPIKEQILKYKDRIDWIEFYPDHYIENPNNFAEIVELSNHFIISPHCLNMSIGSETGAEDNYLDSVAEMAHILNSPWVSDHLCFTNVESIELGHLTPTERTEETFELITTNLKKIKRKINKEFLIENITYDFDFPTNTYTESEFINSILEETDCGLLLDVTNVFINSQNHKFNPYDFINSLNLERIVEIHIAGGYYQNGLWIDSHSERVNREVWDLLDYTIQKSHTKGILLEIDSKFPRDFEEVVNELEIARSILKNHGRVLNLR